MQARILKGQQRSAFGFKLVDESRARIGEEHVPQRIDGESYGLIEFAGVFSLVTP